MANPFISQGMDMQNPEAVQIMRRQKMAEQLLSQGQEPLQGQMVSGHYVAPSWTQGLAKALNTYMGHKGMKEADEAQKALAETLRGKRQEDLSKFAELLSGTPAGNTPVDGVGPVQPAQAPNPGEAYKYAVGSQTPELQQFGMQGLAQMPIMAAQKAEREDARAFRQQEAEANRAARMDELKLRMEDGQRSQQERLQAQKELREMQIQAQKDMQRMIAASRPTPERNAQIIQTENGPMQLVNGQAVPIVGPDGKAVRGTKTPNVESDKKVSEAKDVLNILDEVDKLLPNATGSVAGSAVDAAAGFFGKATEGGKATAQLKTLQGALISKMPKMSGPQSDKDVQLYREMAGQVADPSLPIATRQAASKTIRMMNEKYAGGAPSAPAASPQDAQAMEWARSNPNDPRSKAIMQRLGGQ